MIKTDYSRNIVRELDRETEDRVIGWLGIVMLGILAGCLFWFGG